MEFVKKNLLKILCVIALIALFFPMATVSIENDYYDAEVEVVSGLTAAFQGYVALLLIVGPIALIAADYLENIKQYKPIMVLAVPVICIIVTFVAYLQASSIAAIADNAYVDVTSNLGFGGVLCIIAHIGIAIVGFLENKEEIMAMLKK